MGRWINKVAVVTNSGNEIGISIIEKIGETGIMVIGLCKSIDELKYVTDKLKHFTSITLDMFTSNSDKRNIEEMFDNIVSKYGGIDVLINVLNCDFDCTVTEGEIEDFKKLIDTNVSDVAATIRMVAGSMIEKQNRGHIVTISDCRRLSTINKNLFVMTKAAVSSVNEILRHEFRYMNANIKTTHIEVEHANGFDALSQNTTKGIKAIAEIVMNILNTPEHLQIHELWLDILNE